MLPSTFQLSTADGPKIFVRRWAPSGRKPKASIIIAHGAAEHGQRYERVAKALTARAYVVYAPDHRGHGKTAEVLDKAGKAGLDGAHGMIRDLQQLAKVALSETARAPVFLLGHSTGALLAERFIQLHGALLRGVVLSGSQGLQPDLDRTATIAAGAAKGSDADQLSTLFQQSLAGLNQGFEPAKTGFEWLSRDPLEVLKYRDDPWCGFPLSNRLVAELARMSVETSRPENLALTPKTLPILLLAGQDDPLGGKGVYVEKLAQAYRAAGMRDITLTLYPAGRHEMFNETNRHQVQADLLAWLEKH
jgi:alpha-beta hydrolase superfamily lysophospholipase